MKNILMRFLLAAVTFPLFGIFVFLIPQYNHIGLSLALILASTLGAFELARMFKKIGIEVSYTLSIVSGFLIPTFFWLADTPELPAFLHLPQYSKPILFTILILINLLTEIINTSEKQWKSTLGIMSGHLMIILYPAYLMTYIIKIGSLDNSIYAFFTFFVLVFANDSFAYFCGILFGKKTWKPFPVSPNKSIAGYIGGFLFTIIAGIILYFIKPEVFRNNLTIGIYLGILVSISSNLGDLVESAIKRAADVKDSGKLMLGRGGVLDSIDSMLFSAPLYYFFFAYIIQN